MTNITLPLLTAAYEADIAIMWSARHPLIVSLLGVAYDSFHCPMWVISEPAGLSFKEMLASHLHCVTPQASVLPLALATDTFMALSYLHGRCFVHGNIKPSNVFFNGHVFKLGDMHCGEFRDLLV